jgi:hypothetical protein
MQKPLDRIFDVNTIEDGIKEAYDTSRTGVSEDRRPGGINHVSDLQSLASRPSHDIPTIAEDAINPSHYRKHPSGIECIEITRHMNFNIGNAIKYIWRHADKGDPVENLQKAIWYLTDEITRLQKGR